MPSTIFWTHLKNNIVKMGTFRQNGAKKNEQNVYFHNRRSNRIWNLPGWCPPTAPPPPAFAAQQCGHRWYRLPTCDFRCWQAALRLKGFSFRGPKLGEWIQIVGGRNLLPNCKLNELIKEMENRLGIVIKVCRLILLGDLGGLVRRLYHNPGHVFRIRFFFHTSFFNAGRSLLY